MNGTFVIERLAGVFLYTLVLLVIFLRLQKAKTPRDVAVSLNIYLAILCVMAFFYIPAKTADLYRHRVAIEMYYDIPWSEFLKSDMFNNSVPVAGLLFYISGLIDIDGLLPAFCAFVFYYNSFYIFKDLSKKDSIDMSTISYTLIFFMSVGMFVEVISGVRCFVSLSILARCFYDEFYNEKSMGKNIVWYLAAVMIHQLSLVVCLIRIVYAVFENKKNLIAYFIGYLLMLGFVCVLIIVDISYIYAAWNKAVFYLTSETAIYSYVWEYIIGAIAYIYIFYVYRKRRKQGFDLTGKKHLSFMAVMLFLVAVFIFEYSIFHRMMTVLVLMSIPHVAMHISKSDIREKNVLLLFSFFLIILVCTRGNLCGYKFFLLQ